MSPSRLSEILNSGAQPRSETAEKILKRLQIDSETLDQALSSLEGHRFGNKIDTEVELESFIVPIQTVNKCRQLLNMSADQFNNQDRYVHILFQVSIPRGLDTLVQQKSEHSEQK